MAEISLRFELPEYPDLELAVIDAIFARPEFLGDEMKDLRASDFASDANRKVFETIFRLHEEGESVDVLAVQTALGSGTLAWEAAARSLTNTFYPRGTYGTWVKYLRDAAQRRQAMLVAVDLVKKAAQKKSNAGAYIGEER